MFLLCKLLNWQHLVTAPSADRCSSWLKPSQRLPLITGQIKRQRSLAGTTFSAGKGSCKEKAPFGTQTFLIPRTSNTGVSSYKHVLFVSTDTPRWVLKKLLINHDGNETDSGSLNRWCYFSLLKYYIYCMRVGVMRYAMVCIRGLEGNLWETDLSFNNVGPWD